jgi:hypothetical protein
MKKLAFFIHGTISPVPIKFIEKLSHAGAQLSYKDIFTGHPEKKLISMHEAPECLNRFNPLYMGIPSDNIYYYQWSGTLGDKSWKEASDFLATQIKMKSDEDEPVKVLIIAHSHGGNVARLTAEILRDSNPNVLFNVVTIATPLSWKPALIMPDNVKTWYQYYNNRDGIQAMGSCLMGVANFDLARSIEQLYEKAETLDIKPQHWRSAKVDSDSIDPHNDLLREKASYIANHAKDRINEQFETSSSLLEEKLVSRDAVSEHSLG